MRKQTKRTSPKMCTIRNQATTLPTDTPILEVRGEVLMPKAGFARLNRDAQQKGEKILPTRVTLRQVAYAS